MKLLEAIFVKEGPMFFYRIWPNPLNPDGICNHLHFYFLLILLRIV